MTADEGRDGDGDGDATTDSVKFSSKSLELEDLISYFPDEILQHILSFIPTKLAISTSILSKQWRHVWKNTPSLSFDSFKLDFELVNKTLTCYTARKMMSLQLYISRTTWNDHNIDKLIKFAMSRDVENMWLEFDIFNKEYTIPDFFYINSSVKHITVQYADMIPRCSVSWTSLKTLSCQTDDKSIAKILSGCPILESLTLFFTHELEVFDLSKLLRLRKLEIEVFLDIISDIWSVGPRKIVAPQIHSLRLKNLQLLCTLGDVSSLTEAKLDCFSFTTEELNVIKVQLIVVRMKSMLEKLQNVQKLTFGESFLKILSLAEFYKPLFPSLKVKDLTLETTISQYVIPSIVRLLQNSPELKKLTVHTMKCNTIPGEYLDNYFAIVGKYPDDCWSSEAKVFGKIFTQNVKPESVASFMELMINSKTTKTLEKMVIKLEDYHLTKRGFISCFRLFQCLLTTTMSPFSSAQPSLIRGMHIYIKYKGPYCNSVIISGVFCNIYKHD